LILNRRPRGQVNIRSQPRHSRRSSWQPSTRPTRLFYYRPVPCRSCVTPKRLHMLRTLNKSVEGANILCRSNSAHARRNVMGVISAILLRYRRASTDTNGPTGSKTPLRTKSNERVHNRCINRGGWAKRFNCGTTLAKMGHSVAIIDKPYFRGTKPARAGSMLSFSRGFHI